eukprot:TRINITY_DN113512_c0_g1_i1.p1 TRINITY_DN113512_c0_g1~~TRINITY_DN113512_c0_g1_i1.p1  ORF type:complete len:144 (-),score=13.08 TRINITY_DN113512_c0_g1_i1:105-536(-)
MPQCRLWSKMLTAVTSLCLLPFLADAASDKQLRDLSVEADGAMSRSRLIRQEKRNSEGHGQEPCVRTDRGVCSDQDISTCDKTYEVTSYAEGLNTATYRRDPDNLQASKEGIDGLPLTFACRWVLFEGAGECKKDAVCLGPSR